jgi:hypothetical protein
MDSVSTTGPAGHIIDGDHGVIRRVDQGGKMIKKCAAVLVFIPVLAIGVLAAPLPAAAITAPPCEIAGPGLSQCAGNVTFSSYYLSTPFRPFQGVSGSASQPDITISFSSPYVRYVRVWANDPDASYSKAWVYQYQCCWIQFASIAGDGQPGVFSVGGGVGVKDQIFTAVKLQSPSGDYVNWHVEYQTYVTPGGYFCKVTAQTSNCLGVTATISPYYQGSIFDPFQGTNNGTGAQAPIDVTFQYPLAKVAVTAVDPDLVGNRMEAYAADGSLLGTANFDGDNQAGWTSVNTKSISAARITRIRLIAADNDYTVFQGITAWPFDPLPLSVSINGPSSITVKGTYTFTASYSNFDPNPTFNWSERFCYSGSCSSWIAIGFNSATLNRTLTPDCSGTGDNSYELQLVMQDSDGRTATANHTTWLCNLP